MSESAWWKWVSEGTGGHKCLLSGYFHVISRVLLSYFLMLEYTLNHVLLVSFFKSILLKRHPSRLFSYILHFYLLSAGKLICSSGFCVVTLKAIPQCFQVANYVSFLLLCNKLTQI